MPQKHVSIPAPAPSTTALSVSCVDVVGLLDEVAGLCQCSCCCWSYQVLLVSEPSVVADSLDQVTKKTFECGIEYEPEPQAIKASQQHTPASATNYTHGACFSNYKRLTVAPL